MKRILWLALGLLALNLMPVFGQNPLPINPNTGLPDKPVLTKFNLDFPGGTPAELVKAIEKATGKPVNVIIPTEDADVQLPPLKMNDVDVAQLFQALENASGGVKFATSFYPTYNYGFETTGTPSDSSIWHFFVNKPAPPANTPAQTKFNLDFPGGTPAELVKALEKAMGKPLNAIIPAEDADVQLPPIKMNDVIISQLFTALQAASEKKVAVQNSPYNNSFYTYTTGYGFTTHDNPVSDGSIWFFNVDKPSLPPAVSTEKLCRFYNLDPYLNRGFSVDDITTAIQTGWKMAGVNPPPELDYHKETKLLIAFGEPSKLGTIDDVLRTLPGSSSGYTNMRGLYNELGNMQSDMKKLRQKVDQLTKMNPAPAAAPEEKSGK